MHVLYQYIVFSTNPVNQIGSWCPPGNPGSHLSWWRIFVGLPLTLHFPPQLLLSQPQGNWLLCFPFSAVLPSFVLFLHIQWFSLSTAQRKKSSRGALFLSTQSPVNGILSKLILHLYIVDLSHLPTSWILLPIPIFIFVVSIAPPTLTPYPCNCLV